MDCTTVVPEPFFFTHPTVPAVPNPLTYIPSLSPGGSVLVIYWTHLFLSHPCSLACSTSCLLSASLWNPCFCSSSTHQGQADHAFPPSYML